MPVHEFNAAVEMALAPGPDEPAPSRFTAWNRLTEWRADETLPQHGVGLQRGGVAAGLEAVKKWREARRECERDAAYWTGRAQSDDAPHVLLRAARAERRLERHIAAGTKRLYRSLKRSSRRAGPALIVLAGARLEGGAIVLPAARGEAPLRLSLTDPSFESPDGWEWTGSVQVVDITDRKGRVTRRTRPGHRTYMARAILRAPAPQAVEPEHIEQVLGVDVGVVVTAYDSSGGIHHMPDEAEATATIRESRRRRARCRRGSRRHDKRGRRLATMQRRRANRQRNARRHIAKAIVTTRASARWPSRL